MTFAEILFALVVGYGVYRLLGPVQKKLERIMLRWFVSGRRRSDDHDIIDVTDSSRKSEEDFHGR
jgi:hypothetical protein